ncbi:type III-A CRISPR-associated protein Cas10/Csm1 [Deltaproteobacteria bacterium TL4]
MSNQQPSLEELILASIFHDIGKFGQRAGALRSEELLETFSPSKDGKHSHLHVLNTYFFIDQLLPLPKNLDRATIASTAANHHKDAQDSQSLADSCLITADHLASGADRYKPTEAEQNEDQYSYIRERLISIFEEIELNQHTFEKGKAQRYPLTPIGNADPKPFKVLSQEESRQEYSKLWNQFIQAIKQNSALNTASGQNSNRRVFEHYLGAFRTTLEQYLWCIPSSSYQSLPDISLYDHGNLTASITQALYLFHQQEGGIPDNSKNDEEQQKFILFGGDLSGIQNYIFDINKSHSAGVAKLFRARSFYLQMLTKACILELQEQLELYSVAQVMDAGGKFMLLLPNTKKTREILLNFEKELQHFLFQQFKGTLAMNTCSIPVSYNDLLLENFSNTLNRFFDTLEAQKLQKFEHCLAESQFSPLFQINYSRDYDGNCCICQKNSASEKKSEEFHRQHPGAEERKICEVCFYQIISLGSELAKSEEYPYFKLYKSPKSEDSGSFAHDLIFGWRVKFLKVVNFSDWKESGVICNRVNHENYAFHPIAGHLPLISESDLEHWHWTGFEKMLSAQGEKVEIGEPKTFEMIAQKSVLIDQEGNPKSKSFLGVLKADVDNLGFIFSIGFPNQKLSISRFATLSRMLNYFFSVRLMEYIRAKFPDIYVIFAGGDDLFLLGPWVALIEFSQDIQTFFQKFTANNPDITFSAGINVVKPSLPIKDMARQTEELLEKSKHFEGKDAVTLFADTSKHLDGKDAVTLFAGTMKWNEFSQKIDDGKFLSKLIQEESVSTGVIYRMLQYHHDAIEFKKGKIKKGIYLSHLSYDLARNIKGPDKFKNAEDYQRFMQFKDHLASARIPLHYALYRNRK